MHSVSQTARTAKTVRAVFRHIKILHLRLLPLPPHGAGLQLQAVHFPLAGGGVGQLFHQGGGVSGLDGLAVGADIFLQLLQGAAQGLGIHGEQLGPQGHVQGGHAGAAPEGVALEALILEQAGVIAHGHGDDVHHLAGVGDDGVVVFRRGLDDVGAADVDGQALHQGHVLRAGLVVWREDIVGPVEHVDQGVLDAGELGARHGVSAHEGHGVGQDLGLL